MNNTSKKIYLCPRCENDLAEHLVGYNLMTYDCHHDDFKAFYPFAVETLTALFAGCVPIAIHSYALEKATKKRWLLPDRPAVFYPNPLVEELTAYIQAHSLDWTYCEMEYSEKSSLLFRDQKEFYVTAPEAGSRFIKRNFDPNLGISLVGYLPQFFEGTNSIRKMSEDLIGDGTHGRHFAISAYMADDHTMLRLSVDPDQYPVEQLVSRLQAVTEKHNKMLEINL